MTSYQLNASEILQFIVIRWFLAAFFLCQLRGIMECWKHGILGGKAENQITLIFWKPTFFMLSVSSYFVPQNAAK